MFDIFADSLRLAARAEPRKGQGAAEAPPRDSKTEPRSRPFTSLFGIGSRRLR